uniref:Envelope glycoprotein E n=1 Tax=anatid alphaherpesvirus 1 TaxID=104388 RepID=A0A6C0N3G9_9ALPH|nr:glycoprotein gE [Anatid alphaherpesvirus 1]
MMVTFISTAVCIITCMLNCCIADYHQVIGTTGQDVTLEPKIRDKLPTIVGSRFKEAWSFTKTTECKAVAPAYICLDTIYCFSDLVMDKDCDYHGHMTVPLGIAYYTVHENSALTELDHAYFTRDSNVYPILGANIRGVKITNSTEANEGLYLLHARINDSSYFRTEVFLLTLKDGALKPTAMPMPTYAPITPKHMDAEAIISLYKTVLVHAGEDMNVTADLSIYHIQGPYNMTIQWFMKPIVDNTCPILSLYEPCLFHPSERECLFPENANCAFASTLNASIVGERKISNCNETGAGWASCQSEQLDGDNNAAIQVMQKGIGLRLTNPQNTDSGLYVVIITIDDKITSWAYTLLSTIDLFVGVTIETHKPAIAEDTMLKSTESTPGRGTHDGRSGLFVVGLGVLGVVTIIILAVSSIFLTTKFLRARARSKSNGIKNAYGSYYNSLPGVEPYSDSDCENGGDFSDDSFENEFSVPPYPHEQRASKSSFRI